MAVLLSIEKFFSALEDYKGLIPVSIDVSDERITWMDMEKYHFYEGFFYKSLNMFSSLKRGKTVSFSTDLTVIENKKIADNCLYPTGFIFHAGRCGSTLLAKALASSKENLVISEAEPLNYIWRIFRKNATLPLIANEKNKNIYRNLLLAMARHRVQSHKHYFIKFTSFNIHFFNFIHSVFPDVPALFLTRDISEIIASFSKKSPAWITHNNPEVLKLYTGSDTPDLTNIIKGFFHVASEQPPGILKHIDYALLKKGNLELILNYFNTQFTTSQIEQMKLQFLFDSKVELNKKIFKE